MPFDKIVGIDWSGAEDDLRGEPIQVAEYYPQTGTVRSVGPLRNPDAPWRRCDVLAYVQREVRDSTVLIGLDFAFSFPYCDLRPKRVLSRCEPVAARFPAAVGNGRRTLRWCPQPLRQAVYS